MFEFLIKRTDGDWFDLSFNQYSAVFHPKSLPSTKVDGWGEYRILVADCEIAFSYEDPGIQVSFECENISEELATKIVEEICSNIIQATGQKGKVLQIT
jgi:hypothetical protein